MDDAGFTLGDAPDDPGDGKPDKPRRRNQRAAVLSGAEFWRSPDGIAHASVPTGNHFEHVRIGGRDFRVWFIQRHLEQNGTGLSGQAQSEIVALAEARALSSGETRRPWRRTALHEGAVILDLGGGDPGGGRRAVRITPDGWQVMEPGKVPVAFLRAPDARPLPMPEADAAKPGDLRRFVNCDEGDDLALVWAWLVCTLRPFVEGGAYPLLLLHGEQGSGKSMAARFLQDLTDPSALTGRALPREERDIFVSALNRHVMAYDNLSGMGDGFADCLCRIATGGGFSARALHTDADESTFIATKPLLLNGIPATITSRPDLADRAISIELRPLRERREQATIEAEFAALRPGLLGLLCDGIAAALRNLDLVKLQSGPRMLDAATWAEAAAEGLGLPCGLIPAAWRANRGAADRALVEVDDVAVALVALCDAQPSGWKGSATDLYRRLHEMTAERITKGPLWPKNAAGLGNRLKRIAPALRAALGIECTAGKGGADGSRFWSVRRL